MIDIDTQDMHLNVKLLKYDTFYKVITRILLSLPKYAKKHHIFLTNTHIGTNCFSLFFFSTTQITVTYNFASKCQRVLSIHIKVIYGKFIHLLGTIWDDYKITFKYKNLQKLSFLYTLYQQTLYIVFGYCLCHT